MINIQKGFIQLGIALMVLTAIGLLGGFFYYVGSNTGDENYPQPEPLREAQDQKVTIEQNDVAPKDAILCNGVYYTQCKDNLKFVCPKSGEAYCEPILDNSTNKIASNILLCNGKQWSNCPSGQNFYCPSQGDAQCLIQNQVSNSQISNNQTTSTTTPVQADLQQVQNLLQQEINKQNSWFDEYLKKQAEIDEKLKPINEEWDRVYAQIEAECPIEFYTGQKVAECNQLTLRLNQLESEASRISGIYPERKTLPKSSLPQYEEWRYQASVDGLSGTITSPNSTTRYRWSCLNPSSCTLRSY